MNERWNNVLVTATPLLFLGIFGVELLWNVWKFGEFTANPFHLLCAGLCFLVALEYWRFGRRADRGDQGLCELCGYDLRGSPSNQCPECGHHNAVKHDGR